MNLTVSEMLASEKKRIVFVHVGKCSGEAAIFFLRKALGDDFELFELHVQGADKKIEEISEKYPEDFTILIAKRDPISRFISAYNWDKHNLFLSGRITSETNRSYFEKFPSVDKLASALSSRSRSIAKDARDFAKFGHMGMGQSYYTSLSVLEKFPSKSLHILETANFDSDIRDFAQAMSGVRPDFEIAQLKGETDYKKSYPDADNIFPTKLSSTARKNLESLLNEDFRVYKRLGEIKTVVE